MRSKLMLRFLLFSILLFLSNSCDFFTSSTPKAEAEETCFLPKKPYQAQSVSFDKDEETYHVVLLDTPFCFKNPLVLNNMRLGRLDEKETKSKAELDYIDEDHSTLYLTADFQIEVKATEKNPQTGTTSSVSSMWTPLIAGAAGAAAGALIANKLSSRPQYVTPPSPSSKSSILRGLDEQSLSNTPRTSKKSFQNNQKNDYKGKKKTYSSSSYPSKKIKKKYKKKKKSSYTKRRRRR